MPSNIKDMMQFVNNIKKGNPQDFVMNMLQQNGGENNPITANLMELIQKGDTKEIESVVRNIAKERGIDYDKEFNSFKQMFGL